MQIFPNPSPIKSIQRGILTTSTYFADITISPVNMTKSTVNILGCYSDEGTSADKNYTLYLNSVSMLKFRTFYDGTAAGKTLCWEVIEYV